MQLYFSCNNKNKTYLRFKSKKHYLCFDKLFVHQMVFSFFCFRAKYHKLKYGTELNQGDMKPPSYDSGK